MISERHVAGEYFTWGLIESRIDRMSWIDVLGTYATRKRATRGHQHVLYIKHKGSAWAYSEDTLQAPLHQFAHRVSTSNSRRCHINAFLGFAAQQNLPLLLDLQVPPRMRKPCFSYDQVWAWAEHMVLRKKCKTEQSDSDSYGKGKALFFPRPQESHASQSNYVQGLVDALTLKGALYSPNRELRKVGILAAKLALPAETQRQAPLIDRSAFLKLTRACPSMLAFAALGWRISAFRAIPMISQEQQAMTFSVPTQKSCGSNIEPLTIRCQCERYHAGERCSLCSMPVPRVDTVDYGTLKRFGATGHSPRRSLAVAFRVVGGDANVDFDDEHVVTTINRRMMWFRKGTARPAKGLKMFNRYSQDHTAHPQHKLPLFLLKVAAELLRKGAQRIFVDKHNNSVQLLNVNKRALGPRFTGRQ
ncbi:MAG: hypothetical protein CL799_02125 [Chromatiales bacterium]|nr:hypothetical protein [Chromatiales bacterium]